MNFSGQKIAVDFGYLTTPETISRIGSVTASFVSHQHTDHFDVNNLKAFGTRVHCPEDVAQLAFERGVEAVALSEGDSVQIGEFNVTAVACDHGPKVTKPVQNFGYLYQVASSTGYFTGDIGACSVVPSNEFDFVMLPVGGGFVFSVEEAAEFIRSINYRGTVIPVHYELPVLDLEAGARFRSLLGNYCNVQVLGTGQSLEIPS